VPPVLKNLSPQLISLHVLTPSHRKFAYHKPAVV